MAGQRPREFTDAERLEIALHEKRRWKGICGTGKQHMAGQRPREFTDAERLEIALREKGRWKGICGTGIERYRLCMIITIIRKRNC